MNYTKKEVDDFLRGYGLMLDSLGKKAVWRKKYQAIFIQTRKVYCEADTLKELVVLFNENKFRESVLGSF